MRNASRTVFAVVVVFVTAIAHTGLAPAGEGGEGPIRVNTPVDELNADGDCSLREAVNSANTDTSVDDCTTGSLSDVIILRADTYTLTREDDVEDNTSSFGDLDITTQMSIRGRGATKTILDGNGTDRVFDIRAGGNLGISDVKIRNGSTIGFHNGGAVIVRNSGSLSLTGAILTNNETNANGGGLAVETSGSATISNTTFSQNQADFSGGGLFNNNNNNMSLYAVTISRNQAAIDGGGWISYGGTLTNSTISGNKAGGDGGGVRVESGFVTIKSSTIANNLADANDNGVGNGGGTSPDDPTLKIGNSIVANNRDKGGEAPDCVGSTESLGYNLIEDTSNCTLTGDLATNVTGDPQLARLANNGGATATRALLSSSPAINAGGEIGEDPEDCPPFDQRGAPRTGCDIGSYERVLCRGIVANRVGTTKGDRIIGTNGKDGIIGLAGEDTLKGLGRRDALCGQGNDDRLLGGDGNDVLDGGGGADTGKGGPGDDRCFSIETKIGTCPRV